MRAHRDPGWFRPPPRLVCGLQRPLHGPGLFGPVHVFRLAADREVRTTHVARERYRRDRDKVFQRNRAFTCAATGASSFLDR